MRADIFTFAQHIPDVQPRFNTEFVDWDNVAAAPSSNFNQWWESLPQESRKNTRRAQKKGITVRLATFDDELIAGIKQIYDETPLRQGRKFWHYGKDHATIKRENSSYVDRSEFIGAYFEGRLIGFIKMVYVGNTSRIMQILSMNRHFDKNPANALITAAMEACAKRSVDYFIYGQYVYGTKANSSITEFKRRNGFVQILLPRYHVPLTPLGRVALATGLHRGLAGSIPEPVYNFLLDTRSAIYDRLLPRSKSEQTAKGGVGSSE
uniref:hypothetical protein n=1 Tax=Horticoccus sp. 23ND18S-11 TaxID=3391832 RepID=UPI0039C91501